MKRSCDTCLGCPDSDLNVTCEEWLPKVTLDIFQKDCERTMPRMTGMEALLNGLIGCCAEAGESIDIFKKYKYQGHTLDSKEIILELGDQLFYIVQSAKALGYRLEDVMRYNIVKRFARYPDGFNPERSREREA